MCLYLCTTSVHNTTQNSSDNLPSYLQRTNIAQMLYIGGKRDSCGQKAELTETTLFPAYMTRHQSTETAMNMLSVVLLADDNQNVSLLRRCCTQCSIHVSATCATVHPLVLEAKCVNCPWVDVVLSSQLSMGRCRTKQSAVHRSTSY